MADKFYANDANVGFEEYGTLEEAKSAAEEMLETACPICDPEWPDWATSIEYGRLIPLATAIETNIRESNPEEDDPDVEYFCDVELVSQPDELAQLRTELEEWRSWAKVEFSSRWCAPNGVSDDGTRYAIRLHLATTDDANAKLETQIARIEKAARAVITLRGQLDAIRDVEIIAAIYQLESAIATEGGTSD